MNLQPSEDLLHFSIKIPGPQFIHFHDGIALANMVLGFHRRFILPDGIHNRVFVKEDIPKDGLPFVKTGLLFKQRDVHILIYPHLAFIRMVRPRKNTQEGCFATAVPGNECNFITFGNMKSKSGKEGFDAVRLTQVLCCHIMHGAKIRWNVQCLLARKIIAQIRTVARITKGIVHCSARCFFWWDLWKSAI